MDLDRATRIADNRNRKAREEFPLFADDRPTITPEQVQAAAARHAEAFQRCSRELLARGDAFRAQVAQVVTAEELAELDRRRAVLPDGPDYHADFWRRSLAERHPKGDLSGGSKVILLLLNAL